MIWPPCSCHPSAQQTSQGIPTPRLPMHQATKLSPANAGVVYINLTAWQEINSDLMHFGELSGWMFPNVDQARSQTRRMHQPLLLLRAANKPRALHCRHLITDFHLTSAR